MKNQCMICGDDIIAVSPIATIPICPTCQQDNMRLLFIRCAKCGYVHYAGKKASIKGIEIDRYELITLMYMKGIVKELVFTGSGLLIIVSECPFCGTKRG